MNRKLIGVGGLVVLLALFFGVNILAGQALSSLRLDLTEDRLYTLTQGSRNIARDLDEPVTLTLFFSEKAARGIPQIETYGRRIREILEEFRRMSHGKLVLEVLDPEPFSDAEDRATAAGIVARRGPGGPVYLGLLGTNSASGQEVIPEFDTQQERFLEYQISRMVYVLAHPDKKKIGLLTSLPINGGFALNPQTQQPMQRPAWQIMRELTGPFEIVTVRSDATEIPADVDLLMLVHPKELSDSTLYAIDQFVLKGGRLLAFVDPLCEADFPPQMRNQMDLLSYNRTSNLSKLLDAWGVEVIEGQVAADAKFGLKVRVDQRSEPITYVPYLQIASAVDKGAMSETDPATSALTVINMASAGVIRAKSPVAKEGEAAANKSGATITPLIQTTETASLLDQAKIAFQPDPKAILADFIPGSQRLTLAARLGGAVKTAFPDGKPAAEPKEGETKPEEPKDAPAPLKESAAPINVVLIADCDMLSDRFWVQEEMLFGQIPIRQKVADNGDFILNVADNLVGSQDLISVRARGVASRPFTRIQDLQRAAETKYLAEQKRLEDEIRKANDELQALEMKKPDGSADALILTPEQEQKIKELRQKMADTNKQLRKVQLNLNKDIEKLGTRLKIINIGLIPAAVGIAAVGLGLLRVSRRKRKVQE